MRYFRGVWVLPSASPALGNGAALRQAGEWSDLLPPEQEAGPDGSPVSSVGAAEHWMMAGGSGGGVGEDCRQIINGHALTQLNSACFCWQASAIMHLITGGHPNASWEETRTPN